jgi:hypothetical protein
MRRSRAAALGDAWWRYPTLLGYVVIGALTQVAIVVMAVVFAMSTC